jgi:hypothetical protein
MMMMMMKMFLLHSDFQAARRGAAASRLSPARYTRSKRDMLMTLMYAWMSFVYCLAFVFFLGVLFVLLFEKMD